MLTDNPAIKNPIWAIELYIRRRLNLFCLIAKKAPTKTESIPQNRSKLQKLSKKSNVIESHLTKKWKIPNLGKIEKTTVETKGAPS